MTLTVEIDTGSATTWDRPPDQTRMGRLHRNNHSIIIAIGPTHTAAHDLAQRITQIVQQPPDTN